MVLVLLVGLAIVVGLIVLLASQPADRSGGSPERRPVGLDLEQRLKRQEAAITALLLRFDKLELRLDLKFEELQRELDRALSDLPAPSRSARALSPPDEPAPAAESQEPAPPPPPLRPAPPQPLPPPPTPQPAPPPPSGPVAPAEAAPTGRAASAADQAAPRARPERTRHRPGRWRKRWRRWEQLLIANWTGLLGVVVVVAGVTFAAINVALGLNPWQRFLLVVAAAGAMALPSLLVRSGSRWLLLSLWMRSGGAALLLFACTAAGGLPHLGLQWLFRPGPSLALLCVALAVNLLLAATTSSQTVAGLHVVVCLVPLAIAPQGGLILAVASLVALVGVVLPLARPWYGHRLLVALAYGLFHGSWVVRSLPLLAGSDPLRNQAALAAALVFTAGTVLLQQPRRLQQQRMGLPLLGQLVNGGGLGLALLLEPPQIAGRALALAGAGGLMALLARRAHKADLPWLRRCDALLAQAFSLAALLSLGPWIANPTLLAAVVLLECLAVLHVARRDPDGLIRQLGWWLSLLAGLALALVALGDHLVLLATASRAIGPDAALAERFQNSLVLLGTGGLALTMQQRLHREDPAAPEPRPPALPGAAALGWIGAALLWIAAGVIAPPAWQPALSVAVLGAALLAGRRWRLPGVVPGVAAAITLLHLQSWFRLLNQLPWPLEILAALTLPPLLLALLLLADRERDACRGVGWLLLCLSGCVWAQQTLLILASGVPGERLVGHAVVLLGGGTLLVAVQLAMMRWRLQAPWPELMGWLGPALLVLGGMGCLPRPWAEASVTALLQLTLVLGRRRKPPGLLAGTIAASGALLLGSWLWMLPPEAWTWQELWPRLLPLLLVIQGLFLREATRPRQAASALLHGTAWALLFSAALASMEGTEAIRSRAATLLVGGQLLAVLQWRLQRIGIAQPRPQALPWLASALTYAGVGLALPMSWQGPGGLLTFGSLLLLARQWRPPGLLVAAGCGAALLHVQLWLHLLLMQSWPPQQVVSTLGPLAVLALLMRLADRDRRVAAVPRPVPTYLIAVSAGLASWLLLAPVSSLIPPVAWLLLALLALELATRLPAGDAPHGLICGVGYLIAFAIGYGLLISQSQVLVPLGAITLPGRFCIELLALGVLLYWWFLPATRGLADLKLWQRLHPLVLEALVLGAVVIVLSEVSVLWRPVAWAALALLLVARPVRRLFAARLQLYAVLVYWLSLGMLLAVLGTLQTPALAWTLQPGQIALLAMALQVGFILASHGQLDIEGLSTGMAWGPLRWLGRRVSQRPHRWLYLPLFAVVAYYLWLRYDRALLTLLWTAEAFVIYGLSAVLRDGKFRLLALIALGACLVRLIAIDMAQTDLGIRGVVFIGVGLLMLGMNALYNRFRSRFESSEPAPGADPAAGAEEGPLP